MTSSKTLFYFCLCFVAGIAAQSVIKIPQTVVWGIFVLGAFCVIAGFFAKKPAMIGFCIFFLVLGIARAQISQFNITNDALSKLNDRPEKITLTGQITAEPDIRATTQKLQVKVRDSIILVTTGVYAPYQYLDTVKITGKLKAPKEFSTQGGSASGGNYQNYLAKDGIYSVMDYPVIEMVSTRHDYDIFSYGYEKVLFLKSKLLDSISMNFSPPDSFILQGMVFGNDKAMPKELKDKFAVTGLSHVTAVSGTNIVILINIAMIFLLALGFWRGQAFYIATAFIWIYMVLIGFPASGVRAAIMGCAVLLAQKLGRQNTGTRVLVLTAGLMLLQNPLLLLYDVGFQLSFLASLGIMHVKPLIDAIAAMVSKKGNHGGKENEKTTGGLPGILYGIFSITIAAQIITLPIMVYNFGMISLIAPVTNVLALPVVEALTVFGFLVSVVGVFSNILGFIFSLPCLLLLWYFEKVLDIFSKPWAVKTIENVSWIWVAGYYVALAGLIWYFNKFKKPKFLGF